MRRLDDATAKITFLARYRLSIWLLLLAPFAPCSNAELFDAPLAVYEVWDESGSRKEREFRLLRFTFFPRSNLGPNQPSGNYCALKQITYTAPLLGCSEDSKDGGIFVKTRLAENNGLYPLVECATQSFTPDRYLLRVKLVSSPADKDGGISGDVHNVTVSRNEGGHWQIEKYNGSFITAGINNSMSGKIVAFESEELRRNGGVFLECRGEKSWFWVEN